MKVVFQGDKGAFSESMALEMYNTSLTMPCKTFSDVFEMVEKGKADAGVIPLENSLTGRISESTMLLMEKDLLLCKEGKMSIEHCIIGNMGSGLEKIKKIYAHPEALSQCRKYLSTLDCELISWWDGAAAARLVKNNLSYAILGHIRIASLYGLKVIKRGIQDEPENYTRFGAISTYMTMPTGEDKTTIAFAVQHKGGKLFDALKPLSDASINMTRLESMPIKEKPWEYAFIADFVGHCKDPKVTEALDAMGQKCSSLKILGSYPIYRG